MPDETAVTSSQSTDNKTASHTNGNTTQTVAG